MSSGHPGLVRPQWLCGRVLTATAAQWGSAGTWKLLREVPAGFIPANVFGNSRALRYCMDEWVQGVLVQSNVLSMRAGVNQIPLGTIHVQTSQTLSISLISFGPAQCAQQQTLKLGWQ